MRKIIGLTVVLAMFMLQTVCFAATEYDEPDTHSFYLNDFDTRGHKDWTFETKGDVMSRQHRVVTFATGEVDDKGDYRIRTNIADSRPENPDITYQYSISSVTGGEHRYADDHGDREIKFYVMDTNTNKSVMVVKTESGNMFIYAYNNRNGYWKQYWEPKTLMQEGIVLKGCDVVVKNKKLFFVNNNLDRVYQMFWNGNEQWFCLEKVTDAE